MAWTWSTVYSAHRCLWNHTLELSGLSPSVGFLAFSGRCAHGVRRRASPESECCAALNEDIQPSLKVTESFLVETTVPPGPTYKEQGDFRYLIRWQSTIFGHHSWEPELCLQTQLKYNLHKVENMTSVQTDIRGMYIKDFMWLINWWESPQC